MESGHAHTGSTREGYQWTKSAGLQDGLSTSASIKPQSNIDRQNTLYDIIVVGAGYAGLTAARDLTTSGARVLLLEARDRIGGRTWTSDVGGYRFEMGGTYVHWGQPNVWREIARYQMQRQLDCAMDLSQGLTAFSLQSRAGSRTINQAQQEALFDSAFQKFMNLDGNLCKSLMPFPHDPCFVEEALSIDQLSIQDRMDQIQDQLTSDECAVVEALLTVLSGSELKDAGLFDLIRVWALCGYSVEGVIALCSLYKLSEGQSAFALKFFQEAMHTRRLSYALNCPIRSIKDDCDKVTMTSRSGLQFRARKVICTIPHNVLSSIEFYPPLHGLQKDVLTTPHVNKSLKVHAEVQPCELRTWMGVTHSGNQLVQAAGEGITAGNAHLVCFGTATKKFQPEADIETTVGAMNKLDSRVDIQRLIFHDWTNDEFARGAWSWLPPGMGTTRSLDVLREPHGNIIFANADWALGWRGFIDGAIEEGTRAAKVVTQAIHKSADVFELN